MSVTSVPAAMAPSMKAALRAGVCGRRSPPTTMLRPPCRRSQVAQACPMRRVTSGVRSVPRQSANVVGAEHVRGLMFGLVLALAAPSATCDSL